MAFAKILRAFRFVSAVIETYCTYEKHILFLDPINNTDFTIEINGKVTCPYANIKRRIGVGCCVYDDKFQKWCKCEDPNAVYNRLTGKCKQRLKLLHSRH